MELKRLAGLMRRFRLDAFWPFLLAVAAARVKFASRPAAPACVAHGRALNWVECWPSVVGQRAVALRRGFRGRGTVPAKKAYQGRKERQRSGGGMRASKIKESAGRYDADKKDKEKRKKKERSLKRASKTEASTHEQRSWTKATPKK